jgi:hypothetical protein
MRWRTFSTSALRFFERIRRAFALFRTQPRDHFPLFLLPYRWFSDIVAVKNPTLRAFPGKASVFFAYEAYSLTETTFYRAWRFDA